jgi:hypothetical protein
MLIVTAIVANGRKANPADASVVPGFRCVLDVCRRGKRLAEGPSPMSFTSTASLLCAVDPAKASG